MTPDVSVIVTAHDRRRYLASAVESVFESTVPSSSYEVVVVKNFVDAELDDMLAKRGCVNVVESSRSLGAKHRRGVESSAGEVVLFLEDDDLFHPAKLEAARRVFSSGEVNYYHNAPVFFLDGESPRPNRNYAASPPLIVDSASVPRSVWGLKPYRFNSCIGISRRLATKHLDLLGKVDLGTEFFWFATALSERGRLAVDPGGLTYYRVGSTGASQVRDISQMPRYHGNERRIAGSVQVLSRHLKSREACRFTHRVLLFINAESLAVDNERMSADTLLNTFRLLGVVLNPWQTDKKYASFMAACLILHLFDPRLSARFVFKVHLSNPG